MSYIKHGSLFVPARAPEVLRLFVDESYLAAESGTVQAGILVLDEWYAREAVPAAKTILAELGATTKEFKASALSKGNRRTYASFLKLFTAGVASVSASEYACSIVTVCGKDFHPSAYVDALCKLITDAFAEYGVVTDPGMTREFSWQLAWLGHHGSYLIKHRISNPLRFTFDNKHRYASIVREKVSVSKAGVGAAIWPRGKLLERVVNTPTWGEFRSRIPAEEWEQLAQGFDKPPRPGKRFKAEAVPGFCDGDWPPWLQKEILQILPPPLVRKYAEASMTLINGVYFHIKQEDLPELLRELEERGIRAVYEPDLDFQ